MKKLLATLLVLVSLTACAGNGGSKEKKITKTAAGQNGDVSVTLTFDADNNITAAELDCSTETAGDQYGQAACKYFTENNSIVAANGEVEVFTGATNTSNAVNKAIRKAVKEAKGE